MARVSAESRREYLIQALVRVVARDGIEGATTRQIAKEAEMTLAALHYCFESKEELLAASYDHLIELLCKEEIVIKPGSGIASAAYQIMEAMVGWYETEDGYSKTQLELFFWVCRHDRERGVNAYNRALDFIGGILRKAAGPEDDKSKIPALARFVSATIDGIIAQGVLTPHDRTPVRETMSFIREILLPKLRV